MEICSGPVRPQTYRKGHQEQMGAHTKCSMITELDRPNVATRLRIDHGCTVAYQGVPGVEQSFENQSKFRPSQGLVGNRRVFSRARAVHYQHNRSLRPQNLHTIPVLTGLVADAGLPSNKKKPNQDPHSPPTHCLQTARECRRTRPLRIGPDKTDGFPDVALGRRNHRLSAKRTAQS